MKKELTEKEQMFLDALFDPENNGNHRKCARIAGYSDNVSTWRIISSLKDEILERTKTYLASHSPKAMSKIVGLLDDPMQPGSKELLNAAKDILDRAGIVKTDKLDVSSNGSQLFILPAKDNNE